MKIEDKRLFESNFMVLVLFSVIAFLLHFTCLQIGWLEQTIQEVYTQQLVLSSITFIIFIKLGLSYIKLPSQLGFIALAGLTMKMIFVAYFCYQQGWFEVSPSESVKRVFVFFYLWYLSSIVYVTVNFLKSLDEKSTDS